MNETTARLYGTMTTDLARFREKQLTPIEEIECSFRIASHYWGEVRRQLVRHEFCCMADEIHFFKNLKPLFASEIEFYNLVYHAEIFLPERGSREWIRFVAREGARLPRFMDVYHDFYEYYKRGQSDRDHDLFTRGTGGLDHCLPERIYDVDASTTTSGDGLVSMLLALEGYDAWLQEKVPAQ